MRRSRSVVVLVVLLILSACGGSSDLVAWRDLTLQLPDGWTVFDDEPTRLSASNVPLGEIEGPGDRPEGDVVAVFLTHEPRTQPGDWRTYASERGAVIEVDEATEIGGLPATRIQLFDDTGDVPLRELVVLVPSRGVVLLAQPVPDVGATDGPEVFDRARDAFGEILASISWGAPVDAPGGAPGS